MKSTAQKFLFYWLPAMLWMVLVLSASSDPFSAEHTGAVLKIVLGWMPPESFDLTHFLIRKLAHLTEYGILGTLWFRAWRGKQPGWGWAWARYAFAASLAVAAIDEFHQGFVPSRTSSPRDVAIDACGVVIAMFVVRLLVKDNARIVEPEPGIAQSSD